MANGNEQDGETEGQSTCPRGYSDYRAIIRQYMIINSESWFEDRGTEGHLSPTKAGIWRWSSPRHGAIPVARR